jgi:hypothetical protein
LTIGCRPDSWAPSPRLLQILLPSPPNSQTYRVHTTAKSTRIGKPSSYVNRVSLRANKGASTEQGCIVTGRQTRQVEMSNLSFITALRSSRSASVLMMLLSRQSSMTLRAVRNADSERGAITLRLAQLQQKEAPMDCEMNTLDQVSSTWERVPRLAEENIVGSSLRHHPQY